ncbi:MAG: hydrolase [Sulfurifustis sp.]
MDIASFRPAWWCNHPHLQTLWPTFISRAARPVLQRERLELPDGDFVDLDWTPGSSGPIVIVLHGLQGSSRSPYVRRLLHAIHQRGWRGVVLHFRGCSGEPNRLPRAYHSGETDDLAFLVKTLREHEPRAKIAVVGYSLGGNVLLKWLGEAGAQAAVQAAVAVCVPLSLDVAARRLNQGFSRVYEWALLQSSLRAIRQRFRNRPAPFDLDALRTVRTCWDFDDKITAPMFGFRDAAHYYEAASARRYLKGIAVKTLIIQSADDPFMTEEVIPSGQELSASTELEVYSGAGHVGFVTGRWPWTARYWLDDYIPDRLAPYLTDRQPTTANRNMAETRERHRSASAASPAPAGIGHETRTSDEKLRKSA